MLVNISIHDSCVLSEIDIEFMWVADNLGSVVNRLQVSDILCFFYIYLFTGFCHNIVYTTMKYDLIKFHSIMIAIVFCREKTISNDGNDE